MLTAKIVPDAPIRDTFADEELEGQAICVKATVKK